MPVDGFLAVDKPGGRTSHDMVAAVRRATGIKKCGHAGTLDPLATGLVVIAIGRATRLVRFVQDLPKEYEATARFGIATDSLDADGAETERSPMEVGVADLETLIPRFTGAILQVPPMVSALKRDGKRLYELAREGVEVERQPRQVVVHGLEILSVGDPPFPAVRFRVVCGKGTYVRAIADDMARELGGRAHLTALRRTKTGAFDVESAITPDGLAGWEEHIVDPSQGLEHLPAIAVDEETAQSIVHGRPVRFEVEVDPESFFRVTHDDRLVAVFQRTEDGDRSQVVLA